MLADDVMIRWMSVDDVPLTAVARWRDALDPDEIARAERFRFDADRSAYIAAHGLLRSVLASVGPYPAAGWRFVRTAGGRPELDPAMGSPLRFSLSRCRGLVAAAVSSAHDVGVDAERCDRAADFEDLARRYFAPREAALVRSEGPDAGRDAFFRLWTLKEALVKATGDGLRRPLDSFAFALDPLAVTFRDAGEESGSWQFFQTWPTAEHVVAAAVRPVDGREVRFVPAAVAAIA